MPIASINPATGETIKNFESLSESQIDEKLQRAADIFRIYRRTSFAEREQWMTRAAEILETEKNDFARLMTTEMGKPIKGAVGEAEKCAWVCRYYAEHARQHLSDKLVETNARKSYVRFQPLGPVLAVMPWNFPFWQVFRFAAPALMAGNAGLLKHAPNVTRCALEIEAIFREAGFPDGLFRTVVLQNDAVGPVIADPRVRAVTLTGSDRAGSQVAEQAGRHLKKSVLELGGSDPFLVLADADLEQAARVAAEARLLNSGQSCIAAKRFIVVEPVADRFLELFVSAMRSRRTGDPLKPDTEIGPQARADLRTNLHRQVEESVRRGARVLLGGVAPEGPGFFYPPTVLTA